MSDMEKCREAMLTVHLSGPVRATGFRKVVLKPNGLGRVTLDLLRAGVPVDKSRIGMAPVNGEEDHANRLLKMLAEVIPASGVDELTKLDVLQAGDWDKTLEDYLWKNLEKVFTMTGLPNGTELEMSLAPLGEARNRSCVLRVCVEYKVEAR